MAGTVGEVEAGGGSAHEHRLQGEVESNRHGLARVGIHVERGVED